MEHERFRSGHCRPRIPTALAVVVAIGLFLAVPGVVHADEPAPPEKKTETGKTAKPAGDTPTRAARGVTVLIPGWTPPASPGDFPEGVTILVPGDLAPDPASPQIRIHVVPGPTGTAGNIPPAAGPDPRERGFDAAREPGRLLPPEGEQPPPTMGPAVEEQVAAFPRKPLPAGQPPRAWYEWAPTSAWPSRDEAYPWNPATFDGLRDDVVWTPESAYPRRDPAVPYPWNPASFDDVPPWSIWAPSDAWGRSLGRAEVITDPSPPARSEEGTEAESGDGNSGESAR